jgi:hypothetical protein
MTLQIGMILREEVVLVGDIWLHREPPPPSPVKRSDAWMGERGYKVRIADDGKMAMARAIDMYQADLIWLAIREGLSSEYWENPESRIEALTNSALSSERKWGTHCLLILCEPRPALFKIECGKDSATEKNICQCTRSAGYVFAGDCFNPATFWATRYLPTDYETEWTIEQLTLLGVHIVADASVINSGAIRGLEIVRADRKGVRRSSPEESRSFAKGAAERSRDIGALIMKPHAPTHSSTPD